MCQARSSCLATPALRRSMNIECWVPNVWMNKWIVSSECCRQAHLSFWQAEKLNTHTDRQTDGQTGATCAQRISLTHPVTWQEHSSKSIVCTGILTTYIHIYVHTHSHIDCLRFRYICDRLSSIVERWLALEFHGESNTARHIDGMCQGIFLFLSSLFPYPSPILCSLPLPRYRCFSFFNVIFLQFRSFRFDSFCGRCYILYQLALGQRLPRRPGSSCPGSIWNAIYALCSC